MSKSKDPEFQTLPPENPLTPAVAGQDLVTARSAQEVMGAIMVAQRFPRDEQRAIQRITTACKRRELAESATYQYSRGGTKIYGASVILLRAIAKRYGNIDFGWQEVERRNGETKINAFAWDMESNSRSSMTFTVKHWRDTQQGGYALTDERDIYEIVANSAARRVRACLEAIIDDDIVSNAVTECEKTLAGNQTEPIADRVKKMVAGFEPLGVTIPMMEKRLQHKLDACGEGELVQMRRIFVSIRDGMGRVADFFDTTAVASAQAGAPQHTMKPPVGATGESGKATEQPKATPTAAEEKTGPKAADDNPELKPAAAAEKAAAPKAPTLAESMVKQVNDKLKEANVNEAQLVGFCRKNKLCGSKAKSLADFKGEGIAKVLQHWASFVEVVKMYPKSDYDPLFLTRRRPGRPTSSRLPPPNRSPGWCSWLQFWSTRPAWNAPVSTASSIPMGSPYHRKPVIFMG